MQNQLIFANIIFGAILVMSFVAILNIKNSLGIAMFTAAMITLFYFWWGYVYFIMSVKPSCTIQEYFFDYLMVLLLIGLFYIPMIGLENKAVIWLLDCLILFVLSVIKYYIANKTEKNRKKKEFVDKKMKTNSLATVALILFLVIATKFKLELLAVWLVFIMEFTHMIYVSFFSKIYETE